MEGFRHGHGGLLRLSLTAEFEGGRHQRRIDMITAIENGEEL